MPSGVDVRIAHIGGDAVLADEFDDVVLGPVDSDAFATECANVRRDLCRAEAADEVVDGGVVALAHHQLDQAPDRHRHGFAVGRIAQRAVTARAATALL